MGDSKRYKYKYPLKLKNEHNLSAILKPRCALTGKATWDSKAQAKMLAKNYKNKFGAKMNAYLCECGGWHIGHKLYHKKAKENQ